MKQQRGYPRVTVTPKAERGLAGGHPWVYDTEVADAQPAENGALVDVISAKGRYLGTGFISLHSKIRVRILSRNANDVFDEAFYLRRLSHAWEYRKTVLSGEVSSCRVIFGEADLFPGLTVDRFGRYLVAQTLSVGIERIKPMLFPLLVKLLRDDGQQIDGLYERNDVAIRAREGLEENKGWFDLSALGLPRPDTCLTDIVENGVRYTVDVENGQKTGFFLDQRFNRQAVARLAQGRTVLDCFTHTGSFALNAAKGGAAHVTAVDVSEAAVEMARRNADINGVSDRMDCVAANVFDLLPRLAGKRVILYQGVFLSCERRLEEFCEAVRSMPSEYVLVAMGRGSDYYDDLRSRYASERVLFVPFIRPPHHLQVTRLASIGVLSYFPDPSSLAAVINPLYCAPNKIFEYARYGVPMISNDIPGLYYLFMQYGCGEVVPSPMSPAAIRHTIEHIYDHYDRYSACAKAYYNSVDIKRLINEVLEERPVER